MVNTKKNMDSLYISNVVQEGCKEVVDTYVQLLWLIISTDNANSSHDF